MHVARSLALLSCLLAAAAPAARGEDRVGRAAAPDRVTYLELRGVVCSRCANRVRSALRGVRGVREVRFDQRRTEATVVRRMPRRAAELPQADLRVYDEQLTVAVRRAGFGASVIPVTWVEVQVDGAGDEDQAARARTALERVPGVRRVEVQASATPEGRRRVRVLYDARRTSVPCLTRALAEAGFTARVRSA